MFVETGKIVTETQLQQMEGADAQLVVPVELDEMTVKQKETMQVSLHDNKSVLGKRRVKESRRMRNRRKREEAFITK